MKNSANKLMISAHAVDEILDFATRYSGIVTFCPLAIRVKFPSFDLKFWQQERYIKNVSCALHFPHDVSLFIEEVEEVIAELAQVNGNFPKPILTSEQIFAMSIEELVSYNDAYVSKVLKFANVHARCFFDSPPAWFPRAAEISERKFGESFPELMEAERMKRELLLQDWKQGKFCQAP
jgi:hypothetical protein